MIRDQDTGQREAIRCRLMHMQITSERSFNHVGLAPYPMTAGSRDMNRDVCCFCGQFKSCKLLLRTLEGVYTELSDWFVKSL